MFWRTKSPLSPNDEEWQLETWRWLLDNTGGRETFRNSKLVLPTSAYFAPTSRTGQSRAEHVFHEIAGHLAVDPSDFDLVAQQDTVNPVLDTFMVVENAPSSPAGTFQSQDNRLRITYDPAQVDDPMSLIATLTHEICHAILFSFPTLPPGGEDNTEFATDLAVAFFGFGLFGANTAFEFQQFSDVGAGSQGWSTRRQGYLSEAEWGFALAVFVLLTQDQRQNALQNLKPGPKAYLLKSLKYLDRNPEVLSDLTA